MQSDNPKGEERKRGFMGRLQRTLDAAKGHVTKTIDTVDEATGGKVTAAKERVGDTAGTVTGKKFRQQFEEFTNVVTTTVVGVHQDQANLRDAFSRLEQDQDELRAALTRLEQSSNNPWWQFWRWRWW